MADPDSDTDADADAGADADPRDDAAGHDLGKVDAEFLAETVYPHLGAGRDDVALGPRAGVDFGVLSVGEAAVVLAADPVSIIPGLGFDRAARFALDVVLADVAVSGLPPTHVTVSLTLPPETTDDQFARLWTALSEEAADLGVSVVAGHTARYGECSYPWVGGATALAVGDPDDVVRPDGARPGDALVVTKGPAVETVGLLTTLFGDRMDLPPDVLADARDRFAEATATRDATTAAAAGPVTAMHDATEGGLQGALCEVASAAGVRLDVDTDAVPVRPGVREVCAYLGVEMWHVTTAGSLVVAVDPAGVDPVLDALRDRGTTAAAVGTVREGSGVYLDGEAVSHPRRDPSWEAWDRLARRDPADWSGE
jgi:hydrogenase expression/formation protein HypE